MSKERAFVRYTKSGKIVPGSLILTSGSYPSGPGLWKEVSTDLCCEQTDTSLKKLILTMAKVPDWIGDITDVNYWNNTIFQLPAYGTPFSKVEVLGEELGSKTIILYNTGTITLRSYGIYNLNIISINDQGIITEALGDGFATGNEYGLVSIYSASLENAALACFEYQRRLTYVSLPNLIKAGDLCFQFCESLNSAQYNLPLLETIGDGCFKGCYIEKLYIPSCTKLGTTVGDNQVFLNAGFPTLSTPSIDITLPAALLTCNSGNPDGDIQYLQSIPGGYVNLIPV